MADFKELLNKQLDKDQSSRKSYEKIIADANKELVLNIKKLKEIKHNENGLNEIK